MPATADLSGRIVANRPASIAGQALVRYSATVQLLAEHGFDRVAPDFPDVTDDRHAITSRGDPRDALNGRCVYQNLCPNLMPTVRGWLGTM